MNKAQNYKISDNLISYLDLSDFMNVPCGTVLRNEGRSEAELRQFILGRCRSGRAGYCHHESKSGVGCGGNSSDLLLVKPNQQHTNMVLAADEVLSAPADGLYSSSTKYVLTVKTADCLPVFFYDGTTVGLLHIGWRGCLNGIIDNFFHKVPNFDRRRAKVSIGPGIGKCCFEVGPEVALLFDKKYRHNKYGDFHVDLPGFVVDELARHGVKYTLNSDACTACDPKRFHSYRREGMEVKQMLSYICRGG